MDGGSRFVLVRGYRVHGRDKVEHRSNDGAVPSPNDNRMWRLLLARLHPDSGGDHELFVFASTVRDAVCEMEQLDEVHVNHVSQRAEHPAVVYFQLWLNIVNPWTYAAHRSESER